MPPDAETVVDVDVATVVVVAGLMPDGSAPPVEVVAITAGRFANSPVPVLSAVRYTNNDNGTNVKK